MPFFDCSTDYLDHLYVEEDFDKDGELSFVIETGRTHADVMLSKEKVERLVKHLTHLLEESK